VRQARSGEVSMRFGWLNRISFRCFWLIGGALMRLWLRLRVENHPTLQGPYVLVGNHASVLDPLLVGAASRRRIVFMMTSVIYRRPRTGWFYRWMRTIPLHPTGGNRQAMRSAREALAAGHVLGVFPEGGLSRDGKLLLGSPGAVALVLGEGVPIVPFGIVGAHSALPPHRWWPRPVRVAVRFGAPIPAQELRDLGGGDRRARLQQATQRVMREIAALIDQRSREDLVAAARAASLR
jgi:1-acyl-sn-glycerol-3-phosphate acyltransferase